MKQILSFVFCAFLSFYSFSQSTQELQKILDLRQKSENSNLTQEIRIESAREALVLAEKTRVDTTILKSSRALASVYYEFDVNEDWVKLNRKNLILAEKVKDTFALAIAHYNLGLNKHFYVYEYDSAYYHYRNTIKLFDKLRVEKNIIAVLHLFMASMQHDEKDYIGAEENAITALRLFESFEKTESNLDNIWRLYNLLGIISSDLERYNEALNYHSQAIDVANRMDDGGYNETVTINNQANVYRDLKDYKRTKSLYRKLIDLREEYEPYDPTFYPLIIDNLAYTNVLAG